VKGRAISTTIARRSLRSPPNSVKALSDGILRTAFPYALLFLAVVVPAGAIAFAGRFDGLYGQDPYAYLDYATGPLAAALRQFRPPPPFYWPPGYPLLIAIAGLVAGAGPFAGQVVSLIAGGLVPVFTALLAGEVWSANRPEQLDRDGLSSRNATTTAFVAGLVTALSGQLWQSSVVVMADTTGLAMAGLGTWALVRYGRVGQARWLILAGAAMSYAVLARWAYALVAVPCVVYVVMILAKPVQRQWLTHLIGVSIAVGVLLGPLLVSTALAMRMGSTGDVPFGADLQVYTWNPLNAARREFVTADGFLTYTLPNGLYYLVAPARPYFFTPLIAWLAVPGLWSFVRRRTAAGGLIVGWAGVLYAFHAGAPWQNARFTLAYLPPLAILVGFGLTEMDARLRLTDHRIGRGALAAVLTFGVVWMGMSGTTLTRGFIERKDEDLSTVRWLQERLPPDAILLTFGFTLTMQHYSPIETIDLSETSPTKIDGLLREGRPAFLFVNTINLQSQWRGRAPSTNYLWLKDMTGIAPIGANQSYTLFHVLLPVGNAVLRPDRGAP
jgi:hypothetical protein